MHVENGWRRVGTTAFADDECILGALADMKGMFPVTGAWAGSMGQHNTWFALALLPSAARALSQDVILGALVRHGAQERNTSFRRKKGAPR